MRCALRDAEPFEDGVCFALASEVLDPLKNHAVCERGEAHGAPDARDFVRGFDHARGFDGGKEGGSVNFESSRCRSMDALGEAVLRWRGREFGELVGGEDVKRSAAAGFGGQDGVKVHGEAVNVADVGDVGFGFGFVDGGGGAVP